MNIVKCSGNTDWIGRVEWNVLEKYIKTTGKQKHTNLREEKKNVPPVKDRTEDLGGGWMELEENLFTHSQCALAQFSTHHFSLLLLI